MKLYFDGPGGTQVVDVDREMSIGRAPENDIPVQDTQISRRHAILRPIAGRIEITDLDSYNGTFINGQRISVPVVVAPGDSVLFGETTATAGEDESSPIPSPVPPPPEFAETTPPPLTPPADLQPPAPPPPPVPVVGEAATMVDSGAGAWTPPAPSLVPRLVVRTGHDEGKELALMEGSEVTIGRDFASGFVMGDGRVSSRHARVYLQGGRLIIEDLGSANGTYVNGARVTTPLAADEESEIQIGESVLIFTRQPSTYFANSPSPTLVGARIESPADVQAAVEQAVARSEKRQRSRSLIYTAIGGTVAVAAGAGIGAFFLAGGGGGGSPNEEDVSERVNPSVVRIDSYDADGFPVSGGSGSIIDLGEGLVLTNNHVGSVGQLEVVNSVNNESIDAVLLAAAPCDDLALLAVEGLDDAASGLKAAEFGDADTLRQGERVIALGYPGAAEQFLDRALSHTSGVVSKTKTVYDVPGSGLPFLRNVIQTDAAINPGNSGGPLFDLEGKQIGVNTARFVGQAGAQNENYAVSITRVQELLETLKSGRSPHWIGATFAELRNNDTGEPLLAIEAVTPGGPAEEAGLAGFDTDYQFLVLAIDGEEVGTLHDYCDVIPEEGTATLTIGVIETGEVVEVDIEVGGTPR